MYEAARDRLDAIRSTWEAEGRPLTGAGSTGQSVEDALCKLLRDTERHVFQLGQALREKRQPGRPMGSNSAPDRKSSGEPPKLKLAGLGLAPSARRRQRPQSVSKLDGG